MQIVNSVSARRHFANLGYWEHLEAPQSLDTSYPYPSLSPSGASTASTEDQPGLRLKTDYDDESMDAHFDMYLMYSHVITDVSTVPVPLYKITWGFSAEAVKTLDGTWTSQSTGALQPTVTLLHPGVSIDGTPVDYPVWTRNSAHYFDDLNWTPE